MVSLVPEVGVDSVGVVAFTGVVPEVVWKCSEGLS